MIVWDQNVDTNGTSLLGYCNIPLIALEKLAGRNGYDPSNYYDPESGYDGWELHGTFNGAVFSLYTRFGQLRIGGHMDGLMHGITESDYLNFDAFVAALTEAVK